MAQEGPFLSGELEPIGEGPGIVGEFGAIEDPSAPPVLPGVPDLNYGPRDRVYARLMPLWE